MYNVYTYMYITTFSGRTMKYASLQCVYTAVLAVSYYVCFLGDRNV